MSKILQSPGRKNYDSFKRNPLDSNAGIVHRSYVLNQPDALDDTNNFEDYSEDNTSQVNSNFISQAEEEVIEKKVNFEEPPVKQAQIKRMKSIK